MVEEEEEEELYNLRLLWFSVKLKLRFLGGGCRMNFRVFKKVWFLSYVDKVLFFFYLVYCYF